MRDKYQSLRTDAKRYGQLFLAHKLFIFGQANVLHLKAGVCCLGFQALQHPVSAAEVGDEV
jgi:hypothetical protein